MTGRLYPVLAALWATVIFVASSQPGGVVGLPSPWDKLAHLLTYAVLAWLLRKSGLPFFWAATLAIFYGASDEWHQSFVPGRFCDAADLLADSIGAVVGAFSANMADY